MSNNILIGAEGVDGANFLCCCLSMSDEVYFNNKTIKEKIEFYFKNMTKVEKKNGLPVWSDVSMLFYSCYKKLSTKVTLSTYQSQKIYNDFIQTSDKKTLISKVHLPISWPLEFLIKKDSENKIVKLFEAKYFIGLINPDLFISLRTMLDEPLLDSLTVEEFNLLPIKTQEKIKSDYKSDIERLFELITNNDKWDMTDMECSLDFIDALKEYELHKEKLINIHKENCNLLKPLITHQWDCNWFLTEDETVENIKILYSQMNLGKCNEKLIREMYKVWINRINYIKKSHIKEFKSP